MEVSTLPTRVHVEARHHWGRELDGAALNEAVMSVRDIKAPSRKFLPLQAAPGLVDGWLRPRIQLLGYPIEIWEQMPAIGAGTFPVAFGDFRRGYLLVDRSEIRITRDDVTNPGHVRYYTRRREGGIVLDSHAIKFLQVV